MSRQPGRGRAGDRLTAHQHRIIARRRAYCRALAHSNRALSFEDCEDVFAETLERDALGLPVELTAGEAHRWFSRRLQQRAIDYLRHRVGTGKTALAESFGDALAREEKLSVTLMPMSLTARGSGRVGEMTTLIAQAFRSVETRATSGTGRGRAGSAVILLIDEGDALAQSRELAQMHHEDRAGVNALIRGVSRIGAKRLPVITILCTNRAGALDPALRRRAAAIFTFARPDDEQRSALFARAFDGAGLESAELQRLVKLTGVAAGRDYGYTHSDLTTRLIPAVLLDAFPDHPIAAARIEQLVHENAPTAPFADLGGV